MGLGVLAVEVVQVVAAVARATPGRLAEQRRLLTRLFVGEWVFQHLLHLPLGGFGDFAVGFASVFSFHGCV